MSSSANWAREKIEGKVSRSKSEGSGLSHQWSKLGVKLSYNFFVGLTVTMKSLYMLAAPPLDSIRTEEQHTTEQFRIRVILVLVLGKSTPRNSTQLRSLGK